MASDANEATHTQCVECSIALPIEIATGPDALRVRCRFCGSVYRGTLLQGVSDQIMANIEILESDAERDVITSGD